MYTEAQRQYHARQEAFRAQLNAEQTARGNELEALLRDADHDRDADRLVTLARLISPDAFACRDSMMENLQRMRSGARGNDPDYASAIATHERVARLSIEGAIRKAQQVMSLVQSWEAQP